MHNLVIETTRMSIEVKNLKMRMESLASRLEFNERRARALESVVVYKAAGDRPEAPPVASIAGAASGSRRETGRNQATGPERGPSTGQGQAPSGSVQEPPAASGQVVAGQVPPSSGSEQPGEGPGQRSRRRRRRRGRRGGGSAVAVMDANRAAAGSSDSPTPDQTVVSQPRASGSASSEPSEPPSPASSGDREVDPSTRSTGSAGGGADDPR
jgi:hypothetical protein